VVTCGEHKCYISLYWKQKNETQGKHHRFYKGKDGFPLDYAHAERQITLMRSEIDRKTFSLDDWKFNKVKERLFENMVYLWLDSKKEEKESHELAKSTVKTYTCYTRNHYVPFFQGIDVRDIHDEDIKRFSSALRKKSLGIRMRRSLINTLHTFYVWLASEGIVKQKDLPFFPRINGNDSRVKVALELEDQQNALNRIPEIHRDIYEFSFETGVRPGELAALKVKDVILRKGIVIIQRTYSACELKEAPKEELKKPIPLSDRARELVEKNMEGKFPDSFLFINPNTGDGYKTNNIGKIWREHSGISVTFYESSRHSFCTQIVEGGATEFEAEILMRHSDPRSTRKYFHANVTKYRDLVNRRGRVVELAKKKEGQG
jgi:integrase